MTAASELHAPFAGRIRLDFGSAPSASKLSLSQNLNWGHESYGPLLAMERDDREASGIYNFLQAIFGEK
jgi:hypothetical protein